jgi:hypothetical protein
VVIQVRNPVRLILYSKSPRGINLIALSLLLVMVCAAPFMIYSLLVPDDKYPFFLSWLFAAGAVLAHIGFLVGVCWLIFDIYFPKK